MPRLSWKKPIVNCFKLAKSMMPTLSPNKLIKFNPLRITWSLPELAKHTRMGIVEMEMLDIMNRLGKLPLEVH